ncbi:MAG: RHS repeat-associated core domain-containing protein, partial [Pseudomonadota bacterium]
MTTDTFSLESQHLRFPGQWFQTETGLHQNWHRDYDPRTGRYLQADPLGLVDG